MYGDDVDREGGVMGKRLTLYLVLFSLLAAGIAVITIFKNTEVVYSDIKSFILGAISSGIVVVVVELGVDWKANRRLRHLCKSPWNEYVSSTDLSQVDYSIVTGEAVLQLIGEGILKITLTQQSNKEKWIGEIYMKDIHQGTMSWSYESHPEWIGTKRVIVPNLKNLYDKEHELIYLVDEKNNGFTVLRRKKVA